MGGSFAPPGVGSSGGVSSVFGRTGAIAAASGDYAAFYQPIDADLSTIAALTPTSGNLIRGNGTAWQSIALVAADIPNLDAAKIATGTIAIARIPVGVTAATVCVGDDVRLSDARNPIAGSIVDSSVASGAAIALSKLATDPLARANHTGTQLASTISNFDTQVRTNRLDQLAAPTAAVSLGTQKITNLATPTLSGDAATKGYVDTSVAAGGSFNPAAVAITGGTIDGASIGATTRSTGAFSTLALTNDLAVADGGTGASSAAAARANLGAIALGDLSSVTPITYSAGVIGINTASGVQSGALSAADWSTFNNKQNSLGFTPVNRAGDTLTGTLVAVAGTTTIAPFRFQSGAALTTPTFGAVEFDGTSLFLTNNSSSPTRKTIAYTDSNIAGNAANVTGTIAVGNGGTGATTAATARANLGLSIGSNVQAWDADLDAIAALAHATGNVIRSNGTAWQSSQLAAGDIASGTFVNARIPWAAPGAIGASTPAAGAFTDLSASGQLSISNPSRIQVVRTTNQSITYTAAFQFQVVVYNSATVDSHSQYSNSTGQMTIGAGRGGFYFVNAAATMDAIGSARRFFIGLFKNGSEYARLADANFASGSFPVLIGSAFVPVVAGDILDIRVACDASGSFPVLGSGTITFFNAIKIA